MEKAAENVEAMFQKAETNLNYLTRKLEFEIQHSGQISEAQNPLRLMKEIESIKKEYSTIKDDIAAIMGAQKDAVDVFRGQLLTMTQLLLKLETKTGQSPEEIPEATMAIFKELTGLLEIPKDELAPVSSSSTVETEATEIRESQSTTDQACSALVTSKTKDTESSQPQQKEASEPTAAEMRASSSEFIEVTQQEFLSVSDLIRGRAKLEDVNRTYRMLWEHFREKGNSEELSPKEMNSMGLRVSGATGEAKLKTLRALKLAQISRSGAVKLL